MCGRCGCAAPPREGMTIENVTAALAPWAYEDGPRALILALKVRGLKSAAAPLVDAMVGCARQARLDVDVVTSVPGRLKERSRRGFDHAEVLARGVARRLGLPALPLLDRQGHQVDQVGLDRAGRLANLTSAFVSTSGIEGRVLLVDDLVTTGATASACAAALKTSGAARVDLLVACRR